MSTVWILNPLEGSAPLAHSSAYAVSLSFRIAQRGSLPGCPPFDVFSSRRASLQVAQLLSSVPFADEFSYTPRELEVAGGWDGVSEIYLLKTRDIIDLGMLAHFFHAEDILNSPLDFLGDWRPDFVTSDIEACATHFHSAFAAARSSLEGSTLSEVAKSMLAAQLVSAAPAVVCHELGKP